MSVDLSKLASVIFDSGKKITQSSYQTLCESIETERFTLNEHVIDYKRRDMFMCRVPFKLNDGTTVLVEESTLKTLVNVNIDRTKLVEYMSVSESNFKKVIGSIYGDI